MGKKRPKSATIGANGIPCPRCGQPTEIKEHVEIGARQRRQPFYYSRWFNCANAECATTLIMRDEFRVFNNPEEGATAARTSVIREQLGAYDAEKPPWD